MTKNQSFWVCHLAALAIILPVYYIVKTTWPLVHEVTLLVCKVYLLWFFLKHHYQDWKP